MIRAILSRLVPWRAKRLEAGACPRTVDVASPREATAARHGVSTVVPLEEYLGSDGPWSRPPPAGRTP